MAVKEMRGVSLRGRKLQVDFASRECQDAFFVHLEKQGSTDRSWRDTPYDSRWVPTSTKPPQYSVPYHISLPYPSRTQPIKVTMPSSNFSPTNHNSLLFCSARDATATRFETAVVTTARFSRFEATPGRQRTASYSRSGTPGSTSGNVTPSGASTPVGVTRVIPRTPRSSQRYELFDPPSAAEFTERRYRYAFTLFHITLFRVLCLIHGFVLWSRSYDEFSTGSGGASGHSDGYEESPSLRGGGESGGASETEYSKRLQSVVVSEPCLTHPHQHPHGPHHPHHPHTHHAHPPELRHLQKERLHIQHQLEQLEDGDSSGSEAAFPRKRVSHSILLPAVLLK